MSIEHDDGIVDHKTNRGGKSSERHQVKTLSQDAEHDERDPNGGRNHQPGDQ